jgi:type VI secretion system protein VasI
MPDQPNDRVRIIDVDMPFGSMVKFMIKWAIAAIPAVIILMVIGTIVGVILAGITAGIMGRSARADSGDVLSALGIDTASSYAGPTSPTPRAPEWNIRESRNPIDDSPTVALSLDASSPASTALRPSPSLIIRCQSNRTDAYIDWNEYLASEDVEVTTRIGRNPASTRSWSVSTNSRASFVPGNVVTFVNELMTADTLVARTTPYGESPITATFVTSGLAEKITPLRQACGWCGVQTGRIT